MEEKVNPAEKEILTIILDFGCFQEISKKANQSVFSLVLFTNASLTSLVTGADAYRNGSLQFCTLPKHLDVRSSVPCEKWPKKLLNNSSVFNILLMRLMMHVRGGSSTNLSK